MGTYISFKHFSINADFFSNASSVHSLILNLTLLLSFRMVLTVSGVSKYFTISRDMYSLESIQKIHPLNMLERYEVISNNEDVRPKTLKEQLAMYGISSKYLEVYE